MEVHVIGGGIGGTVAAVALRRAGIGAVVHEAHGGPAERLGSFLGLGVNGMRVLRDLDLLDAVLDADTVATPTMVFTSWTGKRLGEVSNGRLDDGTPSITIMRGALQRALAEGARRQGVEVRYGERFVGCRRPSTAAGVVARFADGAEARADVLVGADGIRSRVRATMGIASEPRYTGLVNVGGTVARSQLPPTPHEMHMVWGRKAFFGYTVRPTGEAWWFANVGSRRELDRSQLADVPVEEWRRRLSALFAADPSFINDLVGATEDVVVSPIHDMPSLPTWRRGGTVLLGDAAHAVSPSSGQGASMAIEDAITLAKCLRDVPSPDAALERYERLRRPRVERVAATGRRRSSYKALESPLAVRLRDLVMPLAFRVFATERATSWLYDHEIPWEDAVVVDPV